MILAFGFNPYFCKPVEFVRTQAAAPSANLEALALVTESPHGVAPQGGGTYIINTIVTLWKFMNCSATHDLRGTNYVGKI